jgi:Fur family ferric uptake transcriptional regulator
MQSNTMERARHLVRESGARLTVPRTLVLAELLAAGEALSHLEVQRRVEASPQTGHIDRVTLYRVLDWLVDSGLAHRVAGPDRVFRFSARDGGHGAHGHFRCNRCQRMFCMDETSALGRVARAMLPSGFVGESIEFTVSGLCADCAAAR